MKISIGSWAYTIGPYAEKSVDFDTVCQRLSSLGFDGVELGAFDPHPNPNSLASKKQRQELLKRVKDHGLAFSGVAPNLWSESLINTHDQSQYISEFKKNCEFAQDLAIPTVRVDTVQPPGVFSEVSYSTAQSRVLETWKTCADIAADHGLKVTWEAEPGFAFNKPSEIIDLLNGVDKANFGFLYDTCHAELMAVKGARQNGERETFDCQTEFMALVGEHINHVHLIDSDGTLHKDPEGNEETSTHSPFGLGYLNFDKIVPALKEHHAFDAWWTVDLCFWDQAWEATEICLKFMKEAKVKYADR